MWLLAGSPVRRRNAMKRPRNKDLFLEPSLREGMLRLGARGRIFFGWWLARLRAARGLTVEQQAEALGLTTSAMAHLSVCRVPRPEYRAADVAKVADAVGLQAENLERVLVEAEGL